MPQKAISGRWACQVGNFLTVYVLTWMGKQDYAIVLSNGQDVHEEHGIIYLPIYYVMFLQQDNTSEEDLVISSSIMP